MPMIRHRLAIAFARNFAAGLVENAECAWHDGVGLSDDELQVAQKELTRIAARIEATINQKVLAQLGTREEMDARQSAHIARQDAR